MLRNASAIISTIAGDNNNSHLHETFHLSGLPSLEGSELAVQLRAACAGAEGGAGHRSQLPSPGDTAAPPKGPLATRGSLIVGNKLKNIRCLLDL